MEQKEKEEKVDAQKSTGNNMKLYMVCSFVAGLFIAFVIANLFGGCDDQREVNNTVRYTNIEKAINDAVREKEVVDNNMEDSIFVAKIRKGKVHLGGCAVSSDSPMYHCNVCGSDWGDSYEMFNK